MSGVAKLMVLSTAVVVLGSAQSASAQLYNPRSSNVGYATTSYLLDRPTVSPYLNLLRTESEFALPNYHTLVRPEVEHRQASAQQALALRQLQSRVTHMQGQLSGQRDNSQFSTGHPTRFMTYLHYYPSFDRERR